MRMITMNYSKGGKKSQVDVLPAKVSEMKSKGWKIASKKQANKPDNKEV